VRLDPPKERTISWRSPLTFPVSHVRPLFRSSMLDSCSPHARTPFVTASSCSPLLRAWQIMLAASYDGSQFNKWSQMRVYLYEVTCIIYQAIPLLKRLADRRRR
jgi:hypothetical protein